MGLIDWKQISPQLKDDGYLTGSLSITGSLFVNGNDASGTRVSGSGLDGVQLTGVQGETVFDSSTGLHVTQSADKVAQVFIGPKIATTGSNIFQGNQDIYGNLTVDGDVVAQRFIVSSSVSIITQSFSSGSTIFGDDLTDTHNYTGSLFISNSLVVSGTAHFVAENTQSTAITSNNTTVGYPTIFPWVTGLEGSYFQRFNHSTHISEIGRFIAGVLSSSLDVADTTPNTKYWNNVSTTHTLGNTISKGSLFNGVLGGSTYENAKLSINWTDSSYISNTATASYREVQDYLLAKGWMVSSDRGVYGDDTGTNPFHGSYASRIPSTIQRENNFSTNRFTVTANAAGSTNASSNDNYFGLGPLNAGQPVPFTVRIFASQSFSDNYFDSNPEADATYTTSASVDYARSSFGSSNGLILSEILSSQPAVIPSSFQDGDFNNVSGPINGRKYTGNQTDAANISASGYYKTYDIRVGLKLDTEDNFTFKNASDSGTRFYLYTGDIPTDITTGTPNAAISNESLNRTSFGATSRSLSGAPYLQSLSYAFDYSAEVANCFDPAYGYASTVLINSNPTNEWNNVGSTTLTNTTVSVNSNGVQTDDANIRGVLSADKSTQRSVGDLPHIDDIVYCSSSFSFNFTGNVNTTTQNRSTQESTNYGLSFRTQGRNWKNSTQTVTPFNLSLFDSSLIGKSADSGSLIVYSRAQGYDGGSLTGTSEQFTGEDFRIQLNNNVTTFTGDAFVSDTYATNDDGDAVLGDYDLQVKPGYLVDPGGNYGYWFPSSFGSGTYKYYIRRFRTSGNKLSVAIDVGKTLVEWQSSSNGVAAAILFKSSGNGSGTNVSLSRARIYDPSNLISNILALNESQDYFKNPFSDGIDLYGNIGGTKSGTNYTMPLRNVDGMYLDTYDNEFYVILRYKGDPTPVTSISITV